jgi:hypothetical protein
MRCKRCGQRLLLRSEQDLALCSTCQEVLSRPPLIETAFERTDNDATYLVDDLYAIDDGAMPLCAASSPAPPTHPVPSGSSLSHAPAYPPQHYRLCLDGTLFFLSILTIFATVGAVYYLLPHLIGFNSLDALIIVGVCLLWRWWWKILCQRKEVRMGGH